MDHKRLFIADYLTRTFCFAELCARYGISRPTGYKWIERFLQHGHPGLEELSRRPDSCPHRTPEALVEPILELRRKHPSWGAKKMLRVLSRREPVAQWPARATVSDLLKRHGLIEPKRRRRHPGHPGKPETSMTSANDVWCADYKGEFKTGDGVYCYPLTVTDGYSRYLLGCKGLHSTGLAQAKPVFAKLFQQFGLPRIIRTDNGAPFATTAIGRLSRLSVWWIRLGVFPELIQPGRPSQNGRHESASRSVIRSRSSTWAWKRSMTEYGTYTSVLCGLARWTRGRSESRTRWETE